MPAESVRSRVKAFIRADFVEQFIRAISCHWPGSTRSLVLTLRAGNVLLGTALVWGLWRVTGMMSWVADSLIAAAACLLFAYFFERSEGE